MIYIYVGRLVGLAWTGERETLTSNGENNNQKMIFIWQPNNRTRWPVTIISFITLFKKSMTESKNVVFNYLKMEILCAMNSNYNV